jgi:hypothetical protein
VFDKESFVKDGWQSISVKEPGTRFRECSGKSMGGHDLGSWIGRAEQKALLRAIAAGGPEHFALTLADFGLPATGTTVAG